MHTFKATLPVNKSIFWLGNGSNKFVVKISNTNGKFDQYKVNNEFKSDFKMPDLLPRNRKIELKANLRGADFSYTLKDLSRKVIYSQQALNPNQINIEKLNIPDGC